MTHDGTDLGITAGRALETILGGEDAPTDDETQTPEQVRERVMAAVPDSYEGATDSIARAMLRVLETQPDARDLPCETPTAFVVPGTGETIGWTGKEGQGYRRVAPGTGTPVSPARTNEHEYVILGDSVTLWDRAKESATDREREAFGGATGFMAGFAYNQARWLLGLPPRPNPAILTVAASEETRP